MTCKDIEFMLIERCSESSPCRTEPGSKSISGPARPAAGWPAVPRPIRTTSGGRDIPLPDREAAWQAILSRTAVNGAGFPRSSGNGRPPRPAWRRQSCSPSWSAGTSSSGRGGRPASFVRRGRLLSPGYTRRGNVLLSALNGAGEGDLSKAEGRLLGDLLVQTRMLKQVVARHDDPQALELIDEIEMILTDLAT